MTLKTSLVVTSIASPQKILRALAEGAHKNSWNFIMIGDLPSPKDFHLEHCDYYSLEMQSEVSLTFAQNCPTRHYSRKNIGYLIAIKNGADVIVETDDDNMPLDAFWNERKIKHQVPLIENEGWVNAYSYFTQSPIWPRGFPLENIQKKNPQIPNIKKEIHAPIQQGLADDNPDVDALFRLIFPLPLKFEKNRIGLGKKVWCPFNSQNTTFFKEAFPLLYLPSYCSFRMTDIWRSFVAQRICWENEWPLLFHESTVYQERNEHDLLKDLKDEVSGYLNNAKICLALEKLNLKKGASEIPHNLKKCYETLIENQWIDAAEMKLLEAWLSDLSIQ